MQSAIVSAWNDCGNPRSTSDFKEAIPDSWYNMTLHQAMQFLDPKHRKRNPKSFEKIRGKSQETATKTRVCEPYCNDPNRAFDVCLKLCEMMLNSRERRSLPGRTRRLGSPFGLLGASGCIYGEPPVTKGKTIAHSKTKQVPRLALAAMIESGLAAKYRQDLLQRETLSRFRNNLAATMSPHVRPTQITFEGGEEMIDTSWYFFPDGIHADVKPTYQSTATSPEEGEVDPDHLEDVTVSFEDGFHPESIFKLRKRLIKSILSNPILRLGMQGSGRYTRSVTAMKALVHVSNHRPPIHSPDIQTVLDR
jgi:hypothetical protein